MGLILDTSVLIVWEREIASLETIAERRRGQPMGLSVVTAAELLHGVHRADSTERRIRRSAYVEQILGSFPLYEFDLAVARIYAELWASLEQRGTRISAHDLIIGATAVARGDSVVTLNPRDFSRIPGLVLEPVT